MTKNLPVTVYIECYMYAFWGTKAGIFRSVFLQWDSALLKSASPKSVQYLNATLSHYSISDFRHFPNCLFLLLSCRMAHEKCHCYSIGLKTVNNHGSDNS